MTNMLKTSGAPGQLHRPNQQTLANDSARALANAAETWFITATECQREIMGFVSMRLEKDGETAREMLGCKKPEDATAIQSRWIEETLRDYNSEIAKLMTICTRHASGGERSKG